MLDKIFSLSPYIRLAGMQGSDDWPHRDRLIYDHQILYVIQGSGYIVLDGVQHNISAGTMVIIRPNQPHRYIRDKSNPCESFWIHLDWENRPDYDWPSAIYENKSSYWRLYDGVLHYPEHIRPDIDLGERYELPDIIRVQDKEYFREQFQKIYEAYLTLDDTWHLRANAAFYNILYALYNDKVQDQPVAVDKYSYQVSKMIDFIKNNYQRDINVIEIAEQGIYSADYASKIFKEQTHKSVSDYLFDYRLEKAKQLFFNLELSIADIAYMCGFNSDTYFSSAVKKKTGYSPTELRKIVLKNVNQGGHYD